MSGSYFFLSAYADIVKAALGHVIRRIDIAQINHDITGQGFFQPVHIQCAELIPLGHDHQTVCTFGTQVGTGGKRWRAGQVRLPFDATGIHGGNPVVVLLAGGHGIIHVDR